MGWCKPTKAHPAGSDEKWNNLQHSSFLPAFLQNLEASAQLKVKDFVSPEENSEKIRFRILIESNPSYYIATGHTWEEILEYWSWLEQDCQKEFFCSFSAAEMKIYLLFLFWMKAVNPAPWKGHDKTRDIDPSKLSALRLDENVLIDWKEALVQRGLLCESIPPTALAPWNFEAQEEGIRRSLQFNDEDIRHGWETINEKNGIFLSRKYDRGDFAPFHRAVFIVDRPPAHVFNCLQQNWLTELWSGPLRESKLVEDFVHEGTHHQIVYCRLPGFVSFLPRDVVLLKTWRHMEDGSGVVFAKSVHHTAHPNRIGDGIVRLEVIFSATVVRPLPGAPNACTLTHLTKTNFKGLVPKLMYNIAYCSTLQYDRLRRIVSLWNPARPTEILDAPLVPSPSNHVLQRLQSGYLLGSDRPRRSDSDSDPDVGEFVGAFHCSCERSLSQEGLVYVFRRGLSFSPIRGQQSPDVVPFSDVSSVSTKPHLFSGLPAARVECLLKNHRKVFFTVRCGRSQFGFTMTSLWQQYRAGSKPKRRARAGPKGGPVWIKQDQPLGGEFVCPFGPSMGDDGAEGGGSRPGHVSEYSACHVAQYQTPTCHRPTMLTNIVEYIQTSSRNSKSPLSAVVASMPRSDLRRLPTSDSDIDRRSPGLQPWSHVSCSGQSASSPDQSLDRDPSPHDPGARHVTANASPPLPSASHVIVPLVRVSPPDSGNGHVTSHVSPLLTNASQAPTLHMYPPDHDVDHVTDLTQPRLRPAELIAHLLDPPDIPPMSHVTDLLPSHVTDQADSGAHLHSSRSQSALAITPALVAQLSRCRSATPTLRHQHLGHVTVPLDQFPGRNVLSSPSLRGPSLPVPLLPCRPHSADHSVHGRPQGHVTRSSLAPWDSDLAAPTLPPPPQSRSYDDPASVLVIARDVAAPALSSVSRHDVCTLPFPLGPVMQTRDVTRPFSPSLHLPGIGAQEVTELGHVTRDVAGQGQEQIASGYVAGKGSPETSLEASAERPEDSLSHVSWRRRASDPDILATWKSLGTNPVPSLQLRRLSYVPGAPSRRSLNPRLLLHHHHHHHHHHVHLHPYHRRPRPPEAEPHYPIGPCSPNTLSPTTTTTTTTTTTPIPTPTATSPAGLADPFLLPDSDPGPPHVASRDVLWLEDFDFPGDTPPFEQSRDLVTSSTDTWPTQTGQSRCHVTSQGPADQSGPYVFMSVIDVTPPPRDCNADVMPPPTTAPYHPFQPLMMDLPRDASGRCQASAAHVTPSSGHVTTHLGEKLPPPVPSHGRRKSF